MFKVHFKLKEDDYELVAESLDLSHPYFVSIKELILDYDEGMVVNPHLEKTRKRFKDATTLMIPFQNCYLIESVPSKERQNQERMNVITLGSEDKRNSENETSKRGTE